MASGDASPSYIIRRATVGDAEALARLRSALFEELGTHEAMSHDAFVQHSAQAFSDAMSNGVLHVVLAQDATGSGGAVVGSTALIILPRLPSPYLLTPTEGYVQSVYTMPAWRGRGVAKAMVLAAVERARELELGRIRLHATAAGQPLYAAIGFRTRHDEMELYL